MRTLLRRRINEITADQWADGDLNDVLNLGLHQVQKRIMAIDPEAFIYIARAPITALEEFVPKPVGMWYEKAVRLKDSSTGLYGGIEKMDYYLAETLTSGDAVYSHLGRFLAIHPIPSANVTNGVEILYIPVLSMAVDTDVPDVHIGLHDAIVKAAQLSLLPETGEPFKDLQASLDAELLEIPLYYRQSAGQAPALNPQVPKDY